MRAVGNSPLAVGDLGQYRPRKIPANCYINNGAGDAGGILMGLVIVDHHPTHSWFACPTLKEPSKAP
jgi:hypothetical protein